MGKIKKSQGFLKPPQDSICVTNSQRVIPLSLHSAKKILSFLLGQTFHEKIALHFVGKQKIAKLHDLYFNDPTPTDCITFPFEEPDFLGEIVVCPQIAKEYVKKHGGNLYEEITLYIVHAFLHLLGFRDSTPEEIKKIRLEEKKWLATLAKNNLWVTP